MIVEQHAEELAVDFVTALVLGLQDEDALLQFLVEGAVSDEMKDVVRLTPESVLQRTPGSRSAAARSPADRRRSDPRATR